MAFKIKPILTVRQLRRAKWTTAFATFILCCLGVLSYFVDAETEFVDADNNKIDLDEFKNLPKIAWNNQKWVTMEIEEFPRGRIVYFSKNTEVCKSSLLIPGVATLSAGLLAVFYGLCLIYLFLGISIVAEIFMESIEKITSKQQIVTIHQPDGGVRERKVLFWNATVANLTLMALGSSAPEILLAVLETATNLGQCPGELGASTIVGSASFNLLVISALSIYAVSEENDTDEDRDEEMPLGIKRIYDMRVFAITCTSSLWAYVWLWIVLLDQEVEIWEGFLTLVFFLILIVFAYAADRCTARANEKNEAEDEKDQPPVIEYKAYDIYKELLTEQRGNAPQDPESVQRRQKMKQYLKATMNTDQIEKVSFEDLKKQVQGEGLITRIKYRKQVNNMMTGKRPVIAKYEKMKLEHAHADQLDENLKNEFFGFSCLHYSVSESSGKLTIQVLNKKGDACKVRVTTVDGDAKAGEDYIGYNDILEFNKGQMSKTFDVEIKDDDNWEPDEDFFVQLYDHQTNAELVGQDTKTRVTIIDDDKPGQICFQDTKGIKVAPTDEFCNIVIVRKNGSDGKVTVDYETVQLGDQDHVAQEGKHYEKAKGQLVFDNQETEKTVQVKILGDPEMIDSEDYNENTFGFQLSNVHPQGAKLSKKSFQVISIVTDMEQKKKADAYAQLIAKLDQEEEKTWLSQFVTACMLHPTKGEDGEIQDIEAMDGVMHFLTIGWKIFFAIIPPAHYYGGIPCFFISLAVIGIVTYVVGEFANLFGCVLGIKPGITAITFVALGTSLPDTFASMQAAQQEKYADAAVGNVTGSNSVNVFLGLGLPWALATVYESASNGKNYYVPAGSLGFSVVVFIICAICCIICLLIRRKVVGGELGGGKNGRMGSAIFLCFLWLVYIMMSILQAYSVGGKENWEGLTFGIKEGVKCPYPKE